MLSLLLACVALSAHGQVTKNELKYQDLINWGSGGQFDIIVRTGKIPSGVITDPLQEPRNLTGCDSQDFLEPEGKCNYPPIRNNFADVVQVTASLKDAAAGLRCQVKGKGWSDQNREPTTAATATQLEARMCYSSASSSGRSWRKKNKSYPSLSTNCPYLIEKVTVDSANDQGPWVMTKFFDEFDEVPTATFFIMVQDLTSVNGDDTVCGFSNTADQSYILTEVDMGRTWGVITAAIVFSIFSVVLLVVYTVSDTVWYNKTGKGLTFF